MLTVVKASEDEFSLFLQRNIFSSTDAQWTQILLLFFSQDQGFDQNLLDSEQQRNGRLLNSSNVSKSTLTVFPTIDEIITFLSKNYWKRMNISCPVSKIQRLLQQQTGTLSSVLKFLPPLWLRVDPENLGKESQCLGARTLINADQ